MYRTKFLPVLFLLCAVNFCRADDLASKHKVIWNKDGTLNKIIATHGKSVNETMFLKAKVVNVNGDSINKQESVQNDLDKKLCHIGYVYSKPFKLIRGESFTDGKLDMIVHYKNNKAFKSDIYSKIKNKFVEWIYFDENENVIKVEHEKTP